MTIRYKTRGFVLKKTDRDEADRIFTIFTENFGKIEVRGKAIRKMNSKIRSGIDCFSISEIEFIQGKNYKTLTDASVIEKKTGKLAFFNKASSLIDDLIKGEEQDKKIWNLICNVFGHLKNDKYGNKSQLLYFYLMWNMLADSGYLPEINFCSKCRKKISQNGLSFSNKDGGVVCGECSAKGCYRKINSDIVKMIRLILKKDWNTFSKLKITKESKEIFAQVSVNYHLHIKSYLN